MPTSKQNQRSKLCFLCDLLSSLLFAVDGMELAVYELEQLKSRKLCGGEACDEIGWCGRLFGLRRCQESKDLST